MPTSELSDALNPYYAQPRSRQAHVPGQQWPPPAPHHAPHRSELELAISEPPRPAATPPIAHNLARSTNPPGGGIHAVQELLRFLASTREAQEIEHRRRIAWEQEQEAKYKLRQAEMERRMLEMQQEITTLKVRVAFNSPTSSSSVGAPVSNSIVSQLAYSPLVPGSQQPTPSTSPTLSHSPSPAMFSPLAVGRPSTQGPVPAARFVTVHAPAAHGSAQTGRRAGSESEEDDEASPGQYRARRRNHHDRRCLTVQHAMRNHILHMMMLETDKELPDSHAEGTLLGADEAVRFVWDKTPRQSVHNGRMKERVLKDLREKRKAYRHVPDKEFGKKTMDSAFEQAFVTLRHKYKTQRDDSAARAHKQREEVKAQRARRLSRRKLKLGNRAEARNKIGVFEHVTFDGALQMECMSSEESTEEEDGSTGARATVFRIRGIRWRSVRLQRFFDALDEMDKVESVQRPRRGVGRRERYAGPVKEGTVVPPSGVGRWMVSKAWLRGTGTAVDTWAEAGPDVDLGAVLGEESE